MTISFEAQRTWTVFVLTLLTQLNSAVGFESGISVARSVSLAIPRPNRRVFPPLLQHCELSEDSKLYDSSDIIHRNPEVKGRDFQCPSGTAACARIDQPNSCCPIDETCEIIPDTGAGDVGCCPNGQACATDLPVNSCSAGLTSCSNGGCCIAGYFCYGVGCLAGTMSCSVVTTTWTSLSPESSFITFTTTYIVTPTTANSVSGQTLNSSTSPNPQTSVSTKTSSSPSNSTFVSGPSVLSQNPGPSGHAMSAGDIGSIVGAVAGVGSLVLGIYILWRRHPKRQNRR